MCPRESEKQIWVLVRGVSCLVSRALTPVSVFLFVISSLFVGLIILFFSMWPTLCVSDSGCTECTSLWVWLAVIWNPVSDKQYYGSEWITDMWESGNRDCWPTTGLGSLCLSPTLPAQSGPPVPAHGYLQVEVQGHLSGLATMGALAAAGSTVGRWWKLGGRGRAMPQKEMYVLETAATAGPQGRAHS